VVKNKTTVPDMLEELADLYRERNKMYGDNYKTHGDVMMALFPDGLKLKTASDFNRYSCFKEIMTRAGRYAFNFHNGGHEDSAKDGSVYWQMLRELDHDS
jgi:hypothetical protein